MSDTLPLLFRNERPILYLWSLCDLSKESKVRVKEAVCLIFAPSGLQALFYGVAAAQAAQI